MKKREIKNIIVKCGADFLLPICLIFGIYVILHGAFSPGGGFQGGVLVAAAVMLIYLGYGRKALSKVFPYEKMHVTESFSEIIYILLALVGIFIGLTLGTNIGVNLGAYGTEIANLMNDAVGLHVAMGISCLLLILLGVMNPDDEKDEQDIIEESEGK